jgi:hypothetical protein
VRPETVPLLLVALLLLSAQPGVDTVTTVFDGSEELHDSADAVVVAGGTVTVPEGERVTTSLYVIGGTARVEGTLAGQVVQLSGNVSVGGAGAVTGRYQALGGDHTVADGAAVDLERVAEPLTRERSPAASVAAFLLQAGGLAAVSFVVGRRYPDLLSNVSHSIRHHPVVSGTVGLLATVTLLALFVFMAFTILLIPVSLLGLLGGALVYLYAHVCVGFLVGRRVWPERPGPATAAGAVLFLLATRLLNAVPVVGGTLAIAAFVVAIGAVFVTYFGLREFQPPRLGPVE